MDQLELRVKELEDGRARDMDYLEHENHEMAEKIEKLRTEIASLRAQTSTPTPAPRASSDNGSPSNTTNMIQEVTDIKGRLKVVETTMALKQSTVFGCRLNTNENLSDKRWKKINRCDTMYRLCTHFHQNNAVFKAPIKGDYYLDMGVRQKGRGGLEVAFNGRGTSNFKHSYVGNTHGDSQVCHKTIIASLDAGDLVFGIVRRIDGDATINWCAFHGCLISADVATATSAATGLSKGSS